MLQINIREGNGGRFRKMKIKGKKKRWWRVGFALLVVCLLYIFYSEVEKLYFNKEF